MKAKDYGTQGVVLTVDTISPWPQSLTVDFSGDDGDPEEHCTAKDVIPDREYHELVHRGQVRIAYRLASSKYGDRLVFVHGLGWHYWDGRRWVEDDRGMARRAVLDVLRTALGDALGDPDLQKDVRRCESDAGLSGVLAIAAAVEPFAATIADLDADPYLLNCVNGTLDLRTMELRSHDPVDRITKITRAAYDPDAIGATWDKFLERVLPDEEVRGFLQRLAGLGLLGTVRERVLAILTGIGANGKTKFHEAIGYAFGDYAIVAEPDLFLHRDGTHPTGQMDLRGARWVVVSENDKDRRLAEATMKRLTGGETLKARRMHKDFVQFEPSHTALLVTNHLPKVSGDDKAVWDRIRVAPFTVEIPEAEQDKRLGETLQLDADAILAWAVEGWNDYEQRGSLDAPDAVLVATDSYRLDSDAIGRFVNDCCLVNPHSYATTGALFERWCKWAANDGAESMSRKAFGQALDRLGYPATKQGGRRLRLGLGLLAADDDEDEATWSLT